MPLELNNWFWTLIAQMDVYERFEAMRRLNTGGGDGGYAFLRNKWFVVLGWSVIVVLSMLLIAVRRMRREKERQAMNLRFAAEADRLELTAEERDIVEAVANRSGLKQKDAIFTLSEPFDNGLSILMQEVFAAGQDLVERKKLQGTIFSIKEKLGFINPGGPNIRTGKEQSSRNIPMGTVVRLGPAGNRQNARIGAEVIQNDRYELLVRPELPILCKPGDVWTVEYFKAAMTWEFEAITMACNEKGLALNHSERIRFVNRRRFTRVATRRPAQIAIFPVFTEKPTMGVEFTPAEITEIAGPGLRIRTDLKLEMQQRVLLQCELEEGRLVQDIGCVRDIRRSAAGSSVIIELIGVDTRAIDELVRIANLIATRNPQPAHLNSQELLEAGLR
jgi:hypothetical protein